MKKAWVKIAVFASLGTLAALIIVILMGCASQPACQPLYHNSQKVCRVVTSHGHVIFIPYVHFVPKIYTPDNPDRNYEPAPVHVNNPVEPHPVIIEPHPVVVDP